MLDGRFRRSYLIWREALRPDLVIEYVSGDGREEHDRTPETGKFWAYERTVCAYYYAIYDVQIPSIELYRLEDRSYREVPADANGRYPIPSMGIELGLWDESCRGVKVPWLRAWDAGTGKMLPISEERLEEMERDHRLRDEQAAEAGKHRERAERLAAKSKTD